MNKSDFNVHFDLAFQSKKTTEFEKWFTSMAQRVYGNDFELIKAGGRHGDKKSDGRLISSETIFQCYAPESSKTFAQDGPDKVRDSFPEILEYWPNIKKWIFIHNSSDGITTSISNALEDLRARYPSINIETGTRHFLKDELHDKLSLAQLSDLYPAAYLVSHFPAVQMEHIRPLLQKIREGRSSSPAISDFGETPEAEKIDINKLSPDACWAIKHAYKQIRLVDSYFNTLSNPNHANIIQQAMRDEYSKFKDLGHTPDDILANLLKFVGDDGSEPVRAAAYVVVTYYFDSCDIFENAPKVS